MRRARERKKKENKDTGEDGWGEKELYRRKRRREEGKCGGGVRVT